MVGPDPRGGGRHGRGRALCARERGARRAPDLDGSVWTVRWENQAAVPSVSGDAGGHRRGHAAAKAPLRGGAGGRRSGGDVPADVRALREAGALLARVAPGGAARVSRPPRGPPAHRLAARAGGAAPGARAAGPRAHRAAPAHPLLPALRVPGPRVPVAARISEVSHGGRPPSQVKPAPRAEPRRRPSNFLQVPASSCTNNAMFAVWSAGEDRTA